MSAALDENSFYSPLDWTQDQLEEWARKIDAKRPRDAMKSQS